MAAMMVACQTNTTTMISKTTIQQAVSHVLAAHSEADSCMVARGAEQVATLWRESDGTEEDYLALVTNSYVGAAEAKKQLYDRMVFILEQCAQSADRLNNTLQEPTTLIGKGEPIDVDWIISG